MIATPKVSGHSLAPSQPKSENNGCLPTPAFDWRPPWAAGNLVSGSTLRQVDWGGALRQVDWGGAKGVRCDHPPTTCITQKFPIE